MKCCIFLRRKIKHKISRCSFSVHIAIFVIIIKLKGKKNRYFIHLSVHHFLLFHAHTPLTHSIDNAKLYTQLYRTLFFKCFFYTKFLYCVHVHLILILVFVSSNICKHATLIHVIVQCLWLALRVRSIRPNSVAATLLASCIVQFYHHSQQCICRFFIFVFLFFALELKL